jgi:hypothetical protein
MAWWQNPWLPWNYPKDLSNSFIHQLENGLLYLFADILNGLLTVISSIFGLIMSIFQGFIGLLVDIAIAMGPLALPVSVIGTAVMIGIGFLAFQLVKDTPVVGAFV